MLLPHFPLDVSEMWQFPGFRVRPENRHANAMSLPRNVPFSASSSVAIGQQLPAVIANRGAGAGEFGSACRANRPDPEDCFATRHNPPRRSR